MENVLRDIPHVCVYIDDILITGKNEKEHLKTLDEVLKRLEEAGLRLKQNKCAFMLPTVEYLGHTISADGLQPTKEKIRAIIDAPAPQNIAQLRSFLGLINYYAKFLPNLSSTLSPLYRLLKKKVKWAWTEAQREAFKTAKQQLTAPCLLAHYNPDKELTLSCDASPYGLGAVLSQPATDGSEKPVAFASHSLNTAEKKYAQLEKEGLAIVFGVKKFNQYLLGRSFTIYSDHKPLQHLFSESRPVPAMASARIQRWALTLGAYNYVIKYKPGEQQANADSLSRLPLPEVPKEVPIPGDIICMMESLQGTPVSAKQIKQWTGRDPQLARVRQMIRDGWTEQLDNDPDFMAYSRRKTELSIEDDCVLWGSRIVIPSAGREKVMTELHDSHPGITRMKGIARRVVWWPGIDQDLETKVKNCSQCQQHQATPAKAPLHPWEWPQRPWSRIHIDHAGPFLGQLFLIAIDAHSKWMEVEIVSSTSAQCTIRKLRAMFATHGIPDVLVSDNGSGFTSEEFDVFMRRNGIRHITTAPYHPSSNGLAERAVQVLKSGLKKNQTGDIQMQLSRFLFQYRTTPHSTTGVSPAELLMGRQLRSALDLLKPSVYNRVRDKQQKQKTQYDQHTKCRSIVPSDPVFVRNYSSGPKWLPGEVTARRGSQMFKVKLQNGIVVTRHLDQVRIRSSTTDCQSDDEYDDVETFPSTTEPAATVPVPLRRSSRNRHRPNWLIPTH